jgi:sulfate adenylyltransferase subunit 1 (EFTu-like GTPase family)
VFSTARYRWLVGLPHSGHVQVAQLSRVVPVAASSSTRRIVSTSSAAVSASAGRTAEGELGELVFNSRGSDYAITGSR